LGSSNPYGQEEDKISQPTSVQDWAHLYAGKCTEVLRSANACLEVANKAVGARRKIAEHQNDGLPGTPIAIRNFTSWAEAAEAEFSTVYGPFQSACVSARDTAARFIAAADDKDEAEVKLALLIPDDVYDEVASVKWILRANYGAAPSEFMDGVEETNRLIQNPSDDGNIYTPLPRPEPNERACPWCAETIKTAAVVCRFCGRDVEAMANAPQR
jgi:hypothetical protein